MSLGIKTEVFNNTSVVTEGWYWVFASKDLRKKKAKGVSLFGRDLVLYRSESGKVRALDAYCPHMGAHLKEGKVEGDSIRCFFHRWQINADGRCVDIPCQNETRGIKPIQTWNVDERYNLIWIWVGDGEPTCSIPEAPELEGEEVSSILGKPFLKECAPGVMMINAIDAQHFQSVHHLSIPLYMKAEKKSRHQIVFDNTTVADRSSFTMRLIGLFYKKRLTYDLSYWFGNTGCVTLGPDFLHFYIMFSLRQNAAGFSEGQTILITKKRSGLTGKIINVLLLKVTQVVGNYFARGDTKIFKSIKFQFNHPIKADEAIVKFIQHVEGQSTLPWGLKISPKEKNHFQSENLCH